MRKVNQITYDLIKSEYGNHIKPEYIGWVVNIIKTEEPKWNSEGINEAETIFKKFRVR